MCVYFIYLYFNLFIQAEHYKGAQCSPSADLGTAVFPASWLVSPQSSLECGVLPSSFSSRTVSYVGSPQSDTWTKFSFLPSRCLGCKLTNKVATRNQTKTIPNSTHCNSPNLVGIFHRKSQKNSWNTLSYVLSFWRKEQFIVFFPKWSEFLYRRLYLYSAN